MNATISYTSFELPFFSRNDEEPEEGCSLSKPEALEAMQAAVPASARFIGSVEEVVENWTSWLSEDYFYLIPWDGADYQWALFRISWDDNWGTWGWESIARIQGVSDYRDAAKQMFSGWMERCQMTGPDYQPYRDIIDAFS